MTGKELIVYSRTAPCSDCATAKRVLDENRVPYTEIMIDLDPQAHARLERLVGFEAVPTLVVARPGELLPLAEPRPLAAGRSPRGVDRGPVITEPDAVGLKHWLTAHGFITRK